MTGRWIIAWACLATGAAQAWPDATPPVAPKLTGKPIQYLDRMYQDAFVDSAGRAWLLVRKTGLGDNRLACESRPALLGIDAGGRIWSTGLNLRDFDTPHATVYDGKQSSDLTGGFQISPDGTLCIQIENRGGAVCDATTWPTKMLSSLPKDVRFDFNPAPVNFDRQGRFMAQGTSYPTWRWDSDKWTKLGGGGRCVLADSGGRLWFSDTFYRLTLVGADNKAGPPYDHPGLNRGAVVEQAPGVCWCVPGDRLMQLGLAEGRRGPKVVVRKQYGDLVPQGDVKRIFLDADGWLWIVTDRLGRIKLPDAATQEKR